MGQKLVTIKFEPGSSSDLWNLDPDFSLEVSRDNLTFLPINTYYPDLSSMRGLPVSLGKQQRLDKQVLQDLIRTSQTAAFLVDDAVTSWRIRYREQFLTGGAFRDLASGSF